MRIAFDLEHADDGIPVVEICRKAEISQVQEEIRRLDAIGDDPRAA